MALKFELADILQGKERSAFEPRVPNTVGSGSFAFVPTTGSRDAPEVLIVELFREIFYDPVSKDPAVQLSPDNAGLDKREAVILRLARGRLKLTRHGGAEGYFAPVFPEQARVTWLRKRTDRTLKLLLLEGAMAQAFAYGPKEDLKMAAEIIVTAMAGSLRVTSPTQVRGKEILSAAVAGVEVDRGNVGLKSHSEAVADLIESLDSTRTAIELHLPKRDPLATRIRDDFVALCALESVLPRLLWLELLKCYLRLAVPAWLLAQTRIATLLRDWILSSVGNGQVPNDTDIKAALASRYVGLFHPTTTGTNELAGHVDRYMKARVELSLLLYMLKAKSENKLFESLLSVDSVGNGRITIEQLLFMFVKLSSASGGGGNALLKQSLIRSAETFAAWTNPLRNGQGKNIDEFLRVLRTFKPRTDDTGYLADGETKEQAVVFPGPTIIRLVLLLTDLNKLKAEPAYRGKLVLADLEKHFSEYGLDFSNSSGARPRLINELARLALLKGSPDAGDYTELLVPIAGTREVAEMWAAKSHEDNA